MKILALEFSAELRSAAVLEEASLAVMVQESERLQFGPLELISRVLSEGGIEREEVECIAVGLGPGSYTGIRSAIAVAEGWALGRSVAVVGVSSFEVLAGQVRGQGRRGRVHFVADAQRGEVYLATYELGAEEVSEVEPIRLAGWREVAERIGAGDLVYGSDGPLVERGVERLVPSAAVLAELARGRTDFVAPERLEPIYLREPSFVKAPRPREIPPRTPQGGGSA